MPGWGEPGHTHTALGAQTGWPKGAPTWPMRESRLLDQTGSLTSSSAGQERTETPTSAQNPE